MSETRDGRPDTPRAALVTGASSGTGRETAFALAQAGYDLGLVGRRVDALDEAAAQISETGRRALALPTDITDAQAVAETMKTFLTWSGDRADVLVNAAGITGPLGNPIGEFAIDLPRPRDVAEVRATPRFVELHQAIWAVLREEVLKGYQQQLAA